MIKQPSSGLRFSAVGKKGLLIKTCKTSSFFPSVFSSWRGSPGRDDISCRSTAWSLEVLMCIQAQLCSGLDNPPKSHGVSEKAAFPSCAAHSSPWNKYSD